MLFHPTKVHKKITNNKIYLKKSEKVKVKK